MAGRPRNEELDDIIHQSTIELLAEVGYQAVSLAEVARRSGTAVTTLYRRYDNVRELIIGSLSAEFSNVKRRLEDTGSLVTDLKLCVETIATDMNPTRASVLAALLIPMRDDAELHEFIRNELLMLGGNEWEKLIQRAIARNELPANTVASDTIAFVIPSFIFFFVMVKRVDVHNSNILDELIHFVLLPALLGQKLNEK